MGPIIKIIRKQLHFSTIHISTHAYDAIYFASLRKLILFSNSSKTLFPNYNGLYIAVEI